MELELNCYIHRHNSVFCTFKWYREYHVRLFSGTESFFFFFSIPKLYSHSTGTNNATMNVVPDFQYCGQYRFEGLAIDT